MLTQIYEVATPREANALCGLGVDHIGILVGDGAFPREQSLAAAAAIRAAVRQPGRCSALFLSADIGRIAEMADVLAPDIVHLGAAIELLTPADCASLRGIMPNALLMRSIPIIGEGAVALALSYQEAVDFLLLDSHNPGDAQIGALGITHDWLISERIVRAVRIPAILAGGLGPENVAEAIRCVRPAGVDSKTKTDVVGTHVKDLGRVGAFVTAARAARSEG
jgi:phosphoribosylanthranilate isomerase